MLSRLIRRRWPIPVIAVGVVVALAAIVVAATGSDEDALVIYNGRSHYGDEQVFKDFEEATGIAVEIRGGTAPELFERLSREGTDTPADVLITTDLANLWRAEEAGLLSPVTSPVLEANVPDGLHDPEGHWWALSVRVRVPVVNTDALDPSDITGYESLGDPRFAGRTCLRTSTSEYNQSLVADFIAKRGLDETRALLEAWMDNGPDIINSDGEMLGAMAAGECDLGLTNHYYLGRAIAEDPSFPVAPAFPEAGSHANVSGIGLVAGSDRADDVRLLMEFLTQPEAQREIVSQSEFAANPDVPPADHIADWDDVTLDPIAVDEAGPLLEEAVALMLEVGWN